MGGQVVEIRESTPGPLFSRHKWRVSLSLSALHSSLRKCVAIRRSREQWGRRAHNGPRGASARKIVAQKTLSRCRLAMRACAHSKPQNNNLLRSLSLGTIGLTGIYSRISFCDPPRLHLGAADLFLVCPRHNWFFAARNEPWKIAIPRECSYRRGPDRGSLRP
jgi:hypothetical protein